MITVTITQMIILALAALSIYLIISKWRDRNYIDALQDLVDAFLEELVVEDDDQGI